MSSTTLAGGAIHKLPADLETALAADAKALDTWRDITPLARNEWICLVISAKQDATRARRMKRTLDQLGRGQRRPCCWEGCPHRQKNSR